MEIFSGDSVVRENIDGIHQAGRIVVGSNHDFQRTPSQADLIFRLRKMQDMGADIPKIAVMPRSAGDVLTLLSATEEMARCYADRPIITMSMSPPGVVSRLCGEVFGSSMTFRGRWDRCLRRDRSQWISSAKSLRFSMVPCNVRFRSPAVFRTGMSG